MGSGRSVSAEEDEVLWGDDFEIGWEERIRKTEETEEVMQRQEVKNSEQWHQTFYYLLTKINTYWHWLLQTHSSLSFS